MQSDHPVVVRDLQEDTGETKEENVEVILGTQLGSDGVILSEDRVDVRRLSRISVIEAFVFPYLLEIPPHRGGRLARRAVANKLNLNMSIDGWRANQIIRLIGASKGVSNMDNTAKPPGWLGRNVTQRGWKKKAESEGKDIVE